MVCFILSKVGDPLEKAAIKGIDWIYTSDEKAISKK
jgi:cation-transporting ATPase 13A1